MDQPLEASPTRARARSSSASFAKTTASAELPALRARNFGFVFQGFNLFPALTAAENVAIAIWMKDPRARNADAEAHGDRRFPVVTRCVTREPGRKTVRDDDPRVRRRPAARPAHAAPRRPALTATARLHVHFTCTYKQSAIRQGSYEQRVQVIHLWPSLERAEQSDNKMEKSSADVQ